jgi:hypothetical protein
MHDEIKRRAYQLIEQKRAFADGGRVEEELKGELPRIVYARSRLQECADADTGDDRVCRAARIYLHALSSFVAERRRQTSANASVPDTEHQTEPYLSATPDGGSYRSSPAGEVKAWLTISSGGLQCDLR